MSEPVIIDQFTASSGATIYAVVKDSQLYLRAILDGRKIHLPPLGQADTERLGITLCKYLEHKRDKVRAASLI